MTSRGQAHSRICCGGFEFVCGELLDMPAQVHSSYAIGLLPVVAPNLVNSVGGVVAAIGVSSIATFIR